MKDTRGVAPRELLNFVEAVLTMRRSSEEHALEKIVLFLRIFSRNIFCKEKPFKSIGRKKSPMLSGDSSQRGGGERHAPTAILVNGSLLLTVPPTVFPTVLPRTTVYTVDLDQASIKLLKHTF